MISNLSNSLRVLPLYNGTAKSLFICVNKIQLRDIHLHQPLLKSIEEKLGLPPKPKRPMVPYFRFLSEIRPSIQAKNPKLKTTEIVAMIGKMWSSLDDTKKEKFAKGYKDELVSYNEVIGKYRDSLSDEDIGKIKETKLEQKERKLDLLQQKKSRDLGKPRRPASSFLRYLKKQTDRQPKEQYLEYLKRISAKWQSLSEDERQKYKTSEQEGETYRKALLQWEDKMRKLGHYDIVSAETVTTADTPKPRARKSSTE